MAEAGLILAVIPLIISAADHYEDCIQPLTRYRHFAAEATKYQLSFGTQKTIFRNESRLLMEKIVDPAVAGAMLLDSNHPDWNSQLYEERFVTLLGESREAYVATVLQITNILTQVKQENRKLEKPFELASETLIDSDRRVWTKSIMKKLKFCFSQSRHEADLSKLKSLNDDYIKLSGQIRQLEGRRLDKKRKPSQLLNHDIARFRNIQKAANYAYQALGAACTKHTEHETQICFNAEQVMGRETSSQQIRFKLAFTQMSLRENSSSKGLEWFFVESIMKNAPDFTQTQPGTQVFSTIQTLNKDSDEPSTSSPQKKLQKRGGPQRPNTHTPEPPVIAPSVQLLNRCVVGNFCDLLRIRLSQSSNAGGCLGRLNDTDGCQHWVYISPRYDSPGSQSNNGKTTSLKSQISRSFDQDRFRRPTTYERVRLAKALSIGLLQYHGTPWMAESLRSNEIYFNEADDQILFHQSPILSEPHFKAIIKASNNSSLSSSPSLHLASNSLLFELGLVLIEIGYTATLQSLQVPQDLELGGGQCAEMLLSKRLGPLISREMGSAYGSVVKKCLQCDFSAGNDLGKPELQAAFNRDVICELDELEKRLEKIYI